MCYMTNFLGLRAIYTEHSLSMPSKPTPGTNTSDTAISLQRLLISIGLQPSSVLSRSKIQSLFEGHRPAMLKENIFFLFTVPRTHFNGQAASHEVQPSWKMVALQCRAKACFMYYSSYVVITLLASQSYTYGKKQVFSENNGTNRQYIKQENQRFKAL